MSSHHCRRCPVSFKLFLETKMVDENQIIKSCSQMVQVIRLQYVINSNLYQGMCSKQGPTLRELCLHFRLRTFR